MRRYVITGGIVSFAIIIVALLCIPAFISSASSNCVSCHKPASDKPGRVHETLACTDCHVENSFVAKIDFGSRVILSMRTSLVNRDDFPRIDTTNITCLGCHPLKDEVTGKDIGINHKKCTEGSTCTKCHGPNICGSNTVSYSTSFDMDACVACHKANNIPTGCTKCHKSSYSLPHSNESGWAYSHGKSWQKTHGMGDLDTCANCHESKFCGKCHGIGIPHGDRYIASHSDDALSKNAKCFGCHNQKDFCSNCHQGYRMPHPKGFLDSHAKTAGTTSNPRCLQCHSATDCSNCHIAHVHPGGPANRMQIIEGSGK